MKVELVVSDSCSTPQLDVTAELIQVRIGLDHDFDDILDICNAKIDSETIALIHRLWADDEFPRNFIRSGDSLIITAREV
ncbi:MAG: hypothetical protein RLZZ478_446 [Actinomycetota bacterium]